MAAIGILLVFVLLQLPAPSAASAQNLAGRVVDSITGQPVAGASVLLHLTSGHETVLTDSLGQFRFSQAVTPGSTIEVSRLGYLRSIQALDGATNDQLIVRLRVDPVKAPAVEAVATANRWLDANGFYQRQRSGLGYFLTQEDLLRKFSAASRPADILRRVPGVTRVEEALNDDYVYLRSTPALGRGGAPCRANVFIDGLPVGDRIPVAHPDNYQAIEVYRGPSEVPPRFGGTEAACGVIVIWTSLGLIKRD